MLLLVLSVASAADLRLETTLHGSAGYGLELAAGDVDGDGYDDLVVGQPLLPGFAVHHGGPEGLEPLPRATFGSPGYGAAIAVGDVDGDGFDDLIAGVSESSALYVHRGGPAGLGGVSAAIAGDRQLGLEVASVGDVDRDGRADIVASGWDGDAAFAWFYPGAGAGLGAAQPLVLPAPAAEPRPLRLVGPGDYDGDGYGDVALSARDSEQIYGERGVIAVYYGTATGPERYWRTTIYASAGAEYARAIGAAGDVTGDGFDDILSLLDADAASPATAFVHYGWHDGPSIDWLTEREGAAASRSAISGAGDLDGDGVDDIAVAWTFPADDGDQVVRLVVMAGSASFRHDVWFDSDPIASGEASPTLGSADFDGDGRSELWLGLGSLDEVRIYGAAGDGAPDPDDTDDPGGSDDPDDTDAPTSPAEERLTGRAIGGGSCGCASGAPAAWLPALLLAALAALYRSRFARSLPLIVPE